MTEINNELIDVTDLIIGEDEPPYFNDEDAFEIYQTCIYLMEEFIRDHPSLITEPDFHDIFDENIEELMASHFDFDIFYTEESEDEMDEIIKHAKYEFFKYVMPHRSFSDSIILESPNIDYIEKQIDILRNKPQPTQRTKEWYEFRHNLITASNAYKAFENQNVKNQLIYEKCQPLNQDLYIDNEEKSKSETKEVVMVNTNSTLHWGQKYEPLSVKIYEYKYQTIIEDFGCIQHDTYLFVGASPDGINVDKNSQRYGRMLEIKNIVNREIDGIPKKEYWVQMQLQMEVCSLNECDFLETKFIEYPDYNAFIHDTKEVSKEVSEEDSKISNVTLSKDDKMKGLIIYFHTKEGKPFYIYSPLELKYNDDIQKWQENIVDIYQSNKEINYTYIKTIYWKLEKLSCVLVCRNKLWFRDNIGFLKEIWGIIEKERVSGYEHRSPNRKQKKELVDLSGNDNSKSSGGCLLQFNKETGKITVIKKDAESIPIPELKNIDIHFHDT